MIVAGVWTACTGSDPDPVFSEGGLDQPCFANGTCNAALACQAGRCRPGTGADAGTSASSGASGTTSSSGASTSTSSGGTTSTSSSSSSGGPDGGPCEQSAVAGGPVCGLGVICTPGQTCCGDGTSPLPLGSCVASCTEAQQVAWQCESDMQCAGSVCCIVSSERAPNSGDACRVEVLANALSRCGPKEACAEPGKRRACSQGADCPSGKCVLHDVLPLTSKTKLVLRVCDP